MCGHEAIRLRLLWDQEIADGFGDNLEESKGHSCVIPFKASQIGGACSPVLRDR